MPFPPSFLALTKRPEFWSQFSFETRCEQFPEIENCRLEFRVGRPRSLSTVFPELGHTGGPGA